MLKGWVATSALLALGSGTNGLSRSPDLARRAVQWPLTVSNLNTRKQPVLSAYGSECGIAYYTSPTHLAAHQRLLTLGTPFGDSPAACSTTLLWTPVALFQKALCKDWVPVLQVLSRFCRPNPRRALCQEPFVFQDHGSSHSHAIAMPWPHSGLEAAAVAHQPLLLACNKPTHLWVPKPGLNLGSLSGLRLKACLGGRVK